MSATFPPFSRALLTSGLFALGVAVAPAQEFAIPRCDQAEDGLRIAILSRIEHAGVSEAPSGEADVRIGWNERGLLVRLSMRDAMRIESGDASLYRGDSVEIFLARTPGSADGVQLIAAPGIAGSAKDRPRLSTYLRGSLAEMKPEIVISGGPDGDGYTIEALIGWSGTGFTPVEGAAFGMQVIINDRDHPFADIGDVNQRNNEIAHLCWFPDRTTVADPSRMQRIVLAARSGPPVQTWIEIDPSLPSPRAVIRVPAIFAGKTLRIGTNAVGAIAEPETGLARIECALDPTIPEQVIADGDRIIGVLRAYRPIPAAVAADLAHALRTADEVERLVALSRVDAQTRDDALLQSDFAALLPTVMVWAQGRTMADAGTYPPDYLCAGVNPMSPPALRRDSPLFPLYALYRARNLIWRIVQGGYPREIVDYLGMARALLIEARREVPDNPIINCYLNQPIPWPGPMHDPLAPDWANHQRQALTKLREIIHWWIDERQRPDGSYGGGWNDDVEMWRQWLAVMVAFEDPKVEAAQRRLSTGVFAQPHLTDGFSSVMEDVEHSSEDTADSITPMLYLAPDDADWQGRALHLTALMREVWTGRNERGQVMFRNIVLNSRQIGRNPKHAFDTTLSSRLMQPALVYWHQSRDPALTPLLVGWLDTWVDAAARAEGGKPAGILPSAIRWPDGGIGGNDGGSWFAIRSYAKLYDWPWYVSDMLHALLMAYDVTGDSRYLAPLRAMAAIRLERIARTGGREPRRASGIVGNPSWGEAIELDPALEPGSRDWCAAQLGPILPGPIGVYRAMTGDTAFDAILEQDGDGYARLLATGDRAALVTGLARAAQAFASDKAIFTSEVRWTDRLFRLTLGYLNRFQSEPRALPDPQLLYASASGDPSTWPGCRMAAVRWHTPPLDIAALVTETGTDRFAAELYHFGPEPRRFTAELLRLAAGTFELEIDAGHAGGQHRSDLLSSGGSVRLKIVVPSRTLYRLRVRRR